MEPAEPTDDARTPTLGILGGLGPRAHVAFERCLLERCVTASDQDYPPWVVLSYPTIPDRTLALQGRGPSPVPAMTAALRRLASLADLAVVPCNTAHAFLDQMELPLPLVHLIGETVARLPAGATVGLLATSGTLLSEIYPRTGSEQRWLTLLDLPDGPQLQEQLVMRAIYGPLQAGRRQGGIKGGTTADPQTGRSHADALRTAADRLLEAGAEIIIAGCTEIPLVLPRSETVIDPMWETAGAVLRRLGKQVY